MAKNTNISPKLLKTAKRQQHFSIRKLTIGATSVLLGTTLWLGNHANVVRADTQNDNGDISPHEATESKEATPQITANTKVEVKQTETSQNSKEANVSTQSQPQIVSKQNIANAKTNIDENDAKEQNVRTDARQNGDQTNSQNDTADNVNNDRNSASQNAIAQSISKKAFKSNELQVSAKQTIAQKSALQNLAKQNLNISALGHAGVKDALKQDSSASLSLLLKDNKLENKLFDAQDKNNQSIKQVSDWNQLVSAANDQNINDIQITQNINASANLQLNRSTALTIESAPARATVGGAAPVTKYTLNLGSNAIDLPTSGQPSITLKNLTITGTNSKAAVQSTNGNAAAHFENVNVNGTPLFNGKGNVYIDGQVNSSVNGIAHSTTPDLNEQFVSLYKAGINTANWYNANILADNVFVDPNAHLTISRDLSGDGIIVEGGLSDGVTQGKFGSVNVGNNAQLDITLKNGHDLAASTEQTSSIDNANTAIFAPQNGQFKTGINATVNIYAGHGRGIIFDEPLGGTSALGNARMSDWARERTTSSGENNAHNDFELGNYTKFNLHSRDGVLIGTNATLNTGEHSSLNFDNHGNGIGLQMDAQAKVEVGPYTDFEMRSDGKNNSGNDRAGNYIGLGDNAQFTVDHDATFRYKVLNTGSNTTYYTDAFNFIGYSKNNAPTLTVGKNAIFDGECDYKNYLGQVLSFSIGSGAPTLNINHARYFNLQRDVVSTDGRGDVFYSFNPCKISINGDSYNVYKWSNKVISQDNFDDSSTKKLQQSIQNLNNSSSEYWTDVKSISINDSKGVTSSTDNLVGKKHQWALNDPMGNGFDFANSQRIALVDVGAKGAVNVVFHDTTTNTDITGYGPKAPLTGDEGTNVSGYDLNKDITSLGNKGYILDASASVPAGDLSSMPAKYTNRAQTVYVNLKHKVVQVTANTTTSSLPSSTPDWAKPDQLKKIVKRMVTYSNNDGTTFTGSAPSNATETLEFDGTAYVDLVNGHVVSVKSMTPDANGNYEITDDTNNQNNIKWAAKSGTSFSAVVSPDETGCHVASVSNHANGNNVAAINGITKDSQDINIEIKYDKDATKPVQNAQVVYRDINDPNHVVTLDSDTDLTGHSGDAVKDDQSQSKIANFENAGYVLVKNEVTGAVFDDIDGNTQTFHVDFKHGTVIINPYNPGKPGQLINPNDPNGPRWSDDTGENQLQVHGSQTVHYTGAGSDTPADQVQNIDFSHEIVIDRVTGKQVADHGWKVVDSKGNVLSSSNSYKFGAETTRVVNGYVADKKTAGGLIATVEKPSVEDTVTYTAIGKIIPFDPNHNPIPNAPTPVYQNDPKNPTSVVPNEPVPDVLGYTPETPTVTPTDPTKDTSVVYNRVANVQNASIIVIDENNDDSQLTSSSTSGQAGSAISFKNMATTIQNYLNQGYKWDYAEADNTRLSATNYSGINFGNFDNNDNTTQKWTICLKHKVSQVDAAHPGNGYTTNQLQHTVTTDVSYVDQNGNAMSGMTPVHETVTFNGQGDYDQVTHNWVNVDQNGNITGPAQGLTWTYSVNGGAVQNGESAILPAIAAQNAAGYTYENVTGTHDPNLVIDQNTGALQAQTVTRQSKNSNLVVHFTRETGSVTVTFRDDDLGLNIQNVGYNSGNQNVGTQIFYNPDNDQSNLEKQGYVYVRTDGNLPAAVSEGNTAIVIHMRHGHQDVSATDPQAEKTIKRTIIVTNPNGDHSDLSQTLQLHRSAVQDQVTKQISYGNWNNGRFAAVTIPVITGYTASQTSIPAVDNVSANYADPDIQIAYTKNDSNQGTEVINYIDSNGEVVGNQVLHGTIGSTHNFALNVPDGYDVGPNQSIQNNSIQIRFANQTPITNNVSVTDHLVRIDPNKLPMAEPILGIVKHPDTATVLPGTKGKYAHDDLTYGDLHEERSRGIIIINPDGSLNKNSIAQTVAFKRWATIDAITGKITFDAWQPVGSDRFDEVTVPTIAGYTPTQSTVTAVENVPSDYAGEPIVVRYNGDPTTQTISYHDQNGQVINTQTINGHVGEDLALKPVIPDGYQLAPSEQIPKQVKLAQNNKTIDITLQPVTVKVDPDEVTVNQPISSKTIIPGTTSKHLAHDITYQDLNKDVTRTITIKQPDGTIEPNSCTQTVHFTRTATVNGATGAVTYGKWVPESSDSLAPVTVPPVAGYTASTQVPAVSTVTTDYKDPKIFITYTPNEQKQTVVYQDEQGHVLGQQVITGKTDQTVEINPSAPDGYTVDSNSQAPTQVKMKANSQPITITVTPKQTVIKASDVTPTKSISTSDVIPGTVSKHPDRNVTYQDLNKDVQRQIIVTLPNGQHKSIVQTVHFAREAHVDNATGKVTFGNWTSQGSDNFAKVNLPTINGYIPTSVASEVDGISEQDSPQTVKINYLPDTPANRLQVAKNSLKDLQQAQDDSVKKLTALQNIAARAGQTSQAAQTAYQKQQTLVKNLAQKASDLQNLLKGTETADEEAKEKAAAAQKKVNELKDKLQSLNNQKQVEQNKLNQENAGLKSDQEQTGQINSDLAAVQANIAAVKKEMAHAQEILDMEKDYIHASLSLSSDYIDAIKNFQAQCDQLYQKVYQENVANGNGVNAKAVAFNTINSNDPDMVTIRNNFYNAINAAGYKLMTKLSGIPAYKFGGIWNKEDAAEKVNLTDLTDQQKKEIDDYTFALINNIRTQLGLKPLHHSTLVDNFANAVAQGYLQDGHSIFNIDAHDAKAVNDAAHEFGLDSINLQPKDYVSHEQKYEDIASWYSDADLVILPDKNGTVKVMLYSGDQNAYHSSPSEIRNGQTNMDSIKQGIFGNMLQMLLEDGLSDWGHTVSLLNLGAMKDYNSSDPQYFLGTSISKLMANESLKTLNLGGYTDHYLNVSSSDAKSGILQPDDDGVTITAPTAAQIAAAQQKLTSDTAKLQQYQEQQTQDQTKLDQIKADMSQRQGRINTIQSRINALNGQISQTNADLLKAEGIQSGADQDKNKNDSALQQQKDALQKAAEDTQKNRTILDDLQNKADDADKQAKAANDELVKLKKRMNQNQTQIGTIKEAIDFGQPTSSGQGQQNTGSQQNNQTGQTSGNQQGTNDGQQGANSSTNTSASSQPDLGSDTDDSDEPDEPDDSGDDSEDDDNENDKQENAPASSSSGSWTKNGSVHSDQLRSMVAGKEARFSEAVKASRIMPLANNNSLKNTADQGALPQTGQDSDTLAGIAGGVAVSLALIGLAGVRKKRREQTIQIRDEF